MVVGIGHLSKGVNCLNKYNSVLCSFDRESTKLTRYFTFIFFLANSIKELYHKSYSKILLKLRVLWQVLWYKSLVTQPFLQSPFY